MTCSAAIRRTGPFSACAIWIAFDISGLSFSAERVTEIAFATNESLPARMPRLFDDGSQVKTSGVIVSLKRAFMNLTASSVCLELIVTAPFSSCSAPPYDQRSARTAMLVSSSCESPMPTGFPNWSLIFLPPARRSSHVSGPFGKPTFSQRSFR